MPKSSSRAMSSAAASRFLRAAWQPAFAVRLILGEIPDDALLADLHQILEKSLQKNVPNRHRDSRRIWLCRWPSVSVSRA